ncbi:MAG: anti-sigma factor [Gemmatimonadaceae bacterium]|nr:anti-sigma factor [Gemmatimonadaceae bacterium]
MTRYSRDELRELAPLHALGATTPDEAAAMEAAMATDPELAAEVASFRDVPAMLATAQPVTPSAALRGQLLAAASALPQDAGPSVASAGTVSGPRRVSAAPSAARRWAPMLAAASLVIATLVGADGLRSRRELDRLRNTNVALAEQLQRRERTLDAMFMGERDLYLVQVGAKEEATGPGIQFFWNAKQGRGVAHVFRLARAPEGRDYQIWALVNGKPVSLVVFNSDAEGHAIVEVDGLATSVNGVTDVLVSLEPKGGSPQPTTAPFIGGTFPGV